MCRDQFFFLFQEFADVFLSEYVHDAGLDVLRLNIDDIPVFLVESADEVLSDVVDFENVVAPVPVAEGGDAFDVVEERRAGEVAGAVKGHPVYAVAEEPALGVGDACVPFGCNDFFGDAVVADQIGKTVEEMLVTGGERVLQSPDVVEVERRQRLP